MSVDPTNTASIQPMLLDEMQDFLVFGNHCPRKLPKVAQDLRPAAQISTRNLAKHEGMHDYQPIDQRLLQLRRTST
jgi:hypothetical protein